MVPPETGMEWPPDDEIATVRARRRDPPAPVFVFGPIRPYLGH